MWNFDASLTEETKKQAAAEMKEKLIDLQISQIIHHLTLFQIFIGIPDAVEQILDRQIVSSGHQKAQKDKKNRSHHRNRHSKKLSESGRRIAGSFQNGIHQDQSGFG